MTRKAKWNAGPLSHVWRFFTRRGRVPYDFEARYVVMVRRAEVEAAAVDRLLSVRAR